MRCVVALVPIRFYNIMANNIKVGDTINALNEQTFKVPTTFSEALLLAGEQQGQIEQQQARIAEMKPKEEFFNQMTGSRIAVDMDSIARIIPFGIESLPLFEILRDNNILQDNNSPMQRYIDAGWFRIVESKYTKHTGDTCIYIKTIILKKGIEGICKLLKELGYKSNL